MKRDAVMPLLLIALAVSAIAFVRELAVAPAATVRPVNIAPPQLPPPQTNAAVPNDAPPVITHLDSRHRTITIKASADGPLYSVTMPDGSEVITDLTLDQIRTADPQLFDDLVTSIAVPLPVDASVGTPGPTQLYQVDE